jgi:competence ComEA-like helix-hairpin-helix protein
MARGVGGHSPANMARYLSGIDFPCEKADLIQHAEDHGAEDEVLEVLHQLPEGEYGTMADVMKGYGEARDGESEANANEGDHQQSRRHSRAQQSRSSHDEEEEAEQADNNGSRQRTRRRAEAQHPQPGRKGHHADKGATLDLNTASRDDFMQVEGMGAQTAEQIIRYREENGPFHHAEELRQVPGIGEATFNRLKDVVSVNAGDRSHESEADETDEA